MDQPTREWTLWELYDRALWENSQIGQCRRCAPNYWYFGKAMLLAQAQVPEGQWKAWCVEHQIQPDRWKRGRHLALAFASADDVAELTIEAADALAREILGLPRRRSTADAKLRRSLTAMKETLKNRLDESGSVTRPDGLRSRITRLKHQLTALDHALAALEHRRASALAKPRRTTKRMEPQRREGTKTDG
jgi:hypothetical protein